MKQVEFMRVLCLLIFIAFSCSSPLEKKKAFGGKLYGGEFTYYSQERTNLFFPFYATSGYDQRILSQIFEPLFKTNEQGLLLNHLAKDYDEIADGKKIRITLRNGVYFQQDVCFDGVDNKLTAEDVKFSLDFACSGNKRNSLSKIFKNKIVGAEEFNEKTKNKFDPTGVSGIRVINDSVVEVLLKMKYSNFQMLLAHPSLTILSKKAYDFYGPAIVNHPIGTGAFQLKSSTKLRTQLARNPNYWQKDEFGNQLPFLEKINIVYTNSIKEEYHSFSKGKADIIFELPVEELATAFGTLTDAQNGKNLLHRFVLRKGVKINYISFDCSSYPFNNSTVRKAICLAIDRRKICLEDLNGEGNYNLHGFVPESNYYKPASDNLVPFDPIQARELLKKAGFDQKNKFPKMRFYLNARKGSIDDKWAKAVAKQLKENLAIELDLVYCSLNKKHQAIASKEAKIWKSTWMPDYPDADSYLSIFYGNKTNRANEGSNFNNFNSALFDNLYKKSEQATTGQERKKIQHQLDKILIDEAAVVPVFSDDLYVIVNLRVRNFNINNTGIIDFSRIYIKEVF